MEKYYEIVYLEIEENDKYEKIIDKVIKKCFETENLIQSNLYVSITLTNGENIKKINKQYRNIDKETDVLSFPMFEKQEIENKIKKQDFQNYDILGDMIISIPKVIEQSKEYGHSFEREFAYMIVHSFYHLMGYDHLQEVDKIIMRKKEENILNQLEIKR